MGAFVFLSLCSAVAYGLSDFVGGILTRRASAIVRGINEPAERRAQLQDAEVTGRHHHPQTADRLTVIREVTPTAQCAAMATRSRAALSRSLDIG